MAEDDFYQLTFAYWSKARSQETLYVELFFNSYAHTSKSISFDTVMTCIHQAQVNGEKTLGIKIQLLICFLRAVSAEYAMKY